MICNISKTEYYCIRCKHWHKFDSKIGIGHTDRQTAKVTELHQSNIKVDRQIDSMDKKLEE